MSTLFQSWIKGGGIVWSTYTPPLAWDWALPLTIQIGSNNTFRVDPTFDLDDYADITVTKTYYLNTVTGNDGNSGLTALLPKKTWKDIYDQGDADCIIIQDGSYVPRDQMLWKPARSIKVIGQGDVYLTNDFVNYIGTWSLVVGKTNTYQCTMVGGEYANVAVDSSVLDSYGRSTFYTYRDSIDLVEANPGSLFWVGGVLYLHTLDSLTPTGRTDITFHYGDAYSATADNRTYYFENINFIGRFSFTSNSATGGLKVYAKDCSMWIISIQGVDECILQNCTALIPGGGDSINFGAANGVETKLIEDSCDFAYSEDSSTNQASTGHQASRVVRIMGKYHDVTGQCIADVDDCMVLMLGSELYESESGIGFYHGGTSAWLDSVNIHDCDTYDLQNIAGSTIYTRNCTFEKGVSDIQGTLTPY